MDDLLSGTRGGEPKYITSFDGALFYSAEVEGYGRELVRSDGELGGAHIVKDVRPGYASSSPTHLAACNGLLFFNANDGTTGEELWASDGKLGWLGDQPDAG